MTGLAKGYSAAGADTKKKFYKVNGQVHWIQQSLYAQFHTEAFCWKIGIWYTGGGRDIPDRLLHLYGSGTRGPPVSFISKKQEMEDTEMSEWIRIRIKDFYKDAVGETEYTYVSHEVYEALADLFRREAHAEEMRDLRHLTAGGYIEGETEEQMAGEAETLEDMVIRRMELEILQKAVQSLTQVQRERLHLYFFEGLTFRQIAERTGVSDMSVRESVEMSLKKIKKFFN